MMLTLVMDAFSFSGAFKDHQLGTLRCRREGASTPSRDHIELFDLRIEACLGFGGRDVADRLEQATFYNRPRWGYMI